MEGKILVAHRSESVLEAVQEMLQNLGYAVTPTTAGPQALAKAMSGRFNLIIVDRNLTGNLDGLWLVERLRKYGVRAPIIGTASEDAWAFPGSLAPREIDCFLPAPFDSQDLVDAVENFLRRTRNSAPNGPELPHPPELPKAPELPEPATLSEMSEPPEFAPASPPRPAPVPPASRPSGPDNRPRILHRTPEKKWEPRAVVQHQGTPRILLVDTQEADRCRLAETLTQAGYEVTLCKSGHEAYETTMLNDFEFILTDLWLVGMDGFEMIETLRKSGVTASIGVLTAYITRDMVRELLPWKIRKIFLKPAKPEAILSFIKNTVPAS